MLAYLFIYHQITEGQTILDEKKKSRGKINLLITPSILKRQNMRRVWQNTIVPRNIQWGVTASKASAPNVRCLISGVGWSLSWPTSRAISTRGCKQTKSLILPSAGSQRRGNRWATPQKTQALLFPLCYPPEESRTVTTVSTHCWNIFILFFCFKCILLGHTHTHSFLKPKILWLFEEKKTMCSVNALGILDFPA